MVINGTALVAEAPLPLGPTAPEVLAKESFQISLTMFIFFLASFVTRWCPAPLEGAYRKRCV